MLSRVLSGVPVGVRFEKERNKTPPPSSSLLLVGGFLNTLQLSFSCCARAGELKMASNNKNPATFFIDNFLPGSRTLLGNYSAQVQMRKASNGLHSTALRIENILIRICNLFRIDSEHP